MDDKLKADIEVATQQLGADKIRQDLAGRFVGRENVYQCSKCRAEMVTIDRDAGVTPFITMCRVDGCGDLAHSRMYRVDQSLVATHEWYRPDDAEMTGYRLEIERHPVTEAAHRRAANISSHVAAGGLLLREIANLESRALSGTLENIPMSHDVKSPIEVETAYDAVMSEEALMSAGHFSVALQPEFADLPPEGKVEIKARLHAMLDRMIDAFPAAPLLLALMLSGCAYTGENIGVRERVFDRGIAFHDAGL